MESTNPTVRPESVVYHVSGDPYLFLLRSLSDRRLDPFSIAEKYGCQLEFRPAQWKQSYDTNYLAPSGAREDGSGFATVLVGEDREKVARARQDILDTLGFKLIKGGWVEVGRKRE